AVGNGPNSTAKRSPGGVAARGRGATGVRPAGVGLRAAGGGGSGTVSIDAGGLAAGASATAAVDGAGVTSEIGDDGSVGIDRVAGASRAGGTSAGASSFLRRTSRGCTPAPNHPDFQASAESKAARPTSSRTPLMTLRYFRRLFAPAAPRAAVVSMD